MATSSKGASVSKSVSAPAASKSSSSFNPTIVSVASQQQAAKQSGTAGAIAASTPSNYYSIPGYGTVTGAQYQAAYAKANQSQRAALDSAVGHSGATNDEGMGRDDAPWLQKDYQPDVWIMGSDGVGRPQNDVVKKADVSQVGSVLGKPQNAQALARAFGVDSALFTSGKLTIGKLANGQYSAIDANTGKPVGNGVTQAQISTAQKAATTPTVTTAGVDKLATQKMTDANAANKDAKADAQGTQVLSDYGIQTTPGVTNTQSTTANAGGNVDWGKINDAVAKGLQSNETKTEDSITMQAQRLESAGRTDDAQKLRDILFKSKELVKRQKADANKDDALKDVNDEGQRKAIAQQQDVSQKENAQQQADFDTKRKALEAKQDQFADKINPMYAEQWGDIRNIQSQIDTWRSENRKLLDENYSLNKEYLSKAEAMDSAAATNRLGALGASEEIMRNSLNQVANDPNRMASRIKVQEQYMNGINSAIEKVNSMYQSIIAKKDSLTDDERTFAEGLKNYAQTLETEKASVVAEGTKAQFEPVKAAVATQTATVSEKATSDQKNKEDLVRYKDGDLQMRQSILQDKLYALIPNLRGRIPDTELKRISNRNGSLAEDLQALSNFAQTSEDKQKLAEFGRMYGANGSSSSTSTSTSGAKTTTPKAGVVDPNTGKKPTSEEIAKNFTVEKINESLKAAKTDEEKSVLNRALALKTAETPKVPAPVNGPASAAVTGKVGGELAAGSLAIGATDRRDNKVVDPNDKFGPGGALLNSGEQPSTYGAKVPSSYTELVNMRQPTDAEKTRATYIFKAIASQTQNMSQQERDRRMAYVISSLGDKDKIALAKVGGRIPEISEQAGFQRAFGFSPAEMRAAN